VFGVQRGRVGEVILVLRTFPEMVGRSVQNLAESKSKVSLQLIFLAPNQMIENNISLTFNPFYNGGIL